VTQKRQLLLNAIQEERARQLNLPGSEFDAKRTPNDWLAISGRYLFGSAFAKNMKPSAKNYQEDLIKAAAVILAALENIDSMQDNDHLSE